MDSKPALEPAGEAAHVREAAPVREPGSASAGIPAAGCFEIVSLNVSDRTGIRKTPVPSARLVEGMGMEGDAHAGIVEDRQVSLLAMEEIEGASALLCAKSESGMVLKPGDFAENITTRGLALHELPLGTRIELGNCLLEVSKIGKDCHAACEIRRLVGDCVMPRRGIFVRVLRGGELRREDRGHYRF
jgi:MOSC domain-containing protein YiiM